MPRGEEFREQQAELSRRASAERRDIGGTPPIKNTRRRGRCKNSLRSFCETYNPEAFTLGWSADHKKVIARIEESLTRGALYAFAMPRGSGKSTLCRMAALWAVAYAHCRYVFVIGANAQKAADTLAAIKTFVRFLPTFVDDFPEIAFPVVSLAGIANRAAGQTCGGQPTLIEWTADRLVLPTVPPPENWPKSWPLRADGMVPTSGGVVSASGLTGDGIRGSLLTLSTGEQVRPDLVLLDDPQTNESAHSQTQNASREQLVGADVLGMAGPGKTISAVMPCTVIARGDFIDRILDRAAHPLWRGERTRMLRTMPTNLIAWDAYFEVYARCAQLEPPDFAESNAHYLAHREELEAGAEASWPDRKLDTEVSAVQHAMHLYFRDRRAFYAEYQNDPLPDGPEASAALDAAELCRRTTNLPRLVVPRTVTRLTAMVDVGAHLLWYAVVGWDERFGGSVLDYGPYPDQNRSHFASTDPRPGLGDLPDYKEKPQEAAIYGGLTAVVSRVLGRSYQQEETGAALNVERCLVDANWGPGTDLVYEFCRRSPHAGVLLPSHGKFVGASGNPMSSWQVKPGERVGWFWRLSPPTSPGRGRHVVFDANHWKTFLAERLRTPEGAPGCLKLYAPGPGRDHRMLAEHCTAEYPVAVARQAGGRVIEEWKNLPGRDNHVWDCLVGCCVGASTSGLSWSTAAAAGDNVPTPKKRVKVNVEDLYAKARAGA